ncbi:MAG: FHA domain-containing protein, partial [bacterium]|nr:FHA domain-containing protein [bacterium]
MKIWFNKLNDSRRHSVDIDGDTIRFGRDAENDIVLRSPLVSKHHAIVRKSGEQLEIENLGVNSCLVGDVEVLGGDRAKFAPDV